MNDRRLRVNFKKGRISSGISDLDTSISSTNFADLPVVDSTTHMLITLDPDTNPEVVKITGHAEASNTITVERGFVGTARAHAMSTVWVHAPVAEDFPVRTYKKVEWTNMTVSSTSYVNVNTELDLVIPAKVNDCLEIQINGNWASGAGLSRMDAVTIVNNAIVNYVSGKGSGGLGVSSWSGLPINQYSHCEGSWMYRVTASDISNGLVKIRFVTKVDSSTRILESSRSVITQVTNHRQ